MKKQLRYRYVTIALGIVVAIVIMLTIWANVSLPAASAPGKPSEISFAIQPVLKILARIELIK